MFAAPINGLSGLRGSANYGQSVDPVKPAKKVSFSDAMVVPVREPAVRQMPDSEVLSSGRSRRRELEAAFNDIASGLQGQNDFYDSAMQGGSYAVVGSLFDAIA